MEFLPGRRTWAATRRLRRLGLHLLLHDAQIIPEEISRANMSEQRQALVTCQLLLQHSVCPTYQPLPHQDDASLARWRCAATRSSRKLGGHQQDQQVSPEIKPVQWLIPCSQVATPEQTFREAPGSMLTISQHERCSKPLTLAVRYEVKVSGQALCLLTHTRWLS